MSVITEVVELVIKDILGSELFLKRKGGMWLGIGILLAFLISLGSGFLLYAVYLRLLYAYTPDTAAAIAGTITLVLASAIVAAVYAAVRRYQRRVMDLQHQINQAIQSGLSLLENESVEAIHKNPKTAVFVTLIIGFILGKRIL